MTTKSDESDTKKITQDEKDVQEIFRESFDKYFQEVERVMPQYLESLTKLQEDFLEAWKNTINSSLDFQKEYAEKASMNTHIPKDAANIIYNMAEEYVKSKNIQNQIVLSTLNSTHSNLKDSKNNFESIVELNRKLLDFWHGFYTKNNS